MAWLKISFEIREPAVNIEEMKEYFTEKLQTDLDEDELKTLKVEEIPPA